jgi:ABC-type transporter MlaC component
VLQPRQEGQEYSIVDSTIAASGNFAANITVAQSGGSNHVKVRYDGVSSNWKISG